MNESTLQRKILDKLRDFYSVKIIVASTSGHPDIIFCKDGRFYAVECKGDKGRLSDLQRYKLKQIRNNGGIANVVSPKNFKWYYVNKIIPNDSYTA